MAQRVSMETEHWRIPVDLSEVSPWVVKATIALEDERFHEHAGVDPRAVARAARDNLIHFRRVSGASTITMQVCRMMDGRKRTYAAKAIESFRALQLEAGKVPSMLSSSNNSQLSTKPLRACGLNCLKVWGCLGKSIGWVS